VLVVLLKYVEISVMKEVINTGKIIVQILLR